MLAIAVRTSGTVEAQQWDAQTFHRWRLGEIDGIRRTETDLDFAAGVWAPDDQQNQQALNQLGAEIAERLARPADLTFRAPYAGDMLITGKQRTGLTQPQADFILSTVEDIFSPLIPDTAESGTAAKRRASTFVV